MADPDKEPDDAIASWREWAVSGWLVILAIPVLLLAVLAMPVLIALGKAMDWWHGPIGVSTGPHLHQRR